jgi:hypothetical protein
LLTERISAVAFQRSVVNRASPWPVMLESTTTSLWREGEEVWEIESLKGESGAWRRELA